MKKYLLTAAALALTASSASATMKSFTGFYMGANLGYGMGRATAQTNGTAPAGAANPNAPGVAQKAHLSVSGMNGGLHLGYGWMLQRVYYLGLEAFGTLSNMQGSNQNKNILAGQPGFTKARFNNAFGAAVHFGGMLNSMLAYVKIGVESASWKFEQTHDKALFGDVANIGQIVGSNKTRRFTGIPMGVGFATMLTDRIRAGAEFVYTHYPSATTVTTDHNKQSISTKFQPKKTEFNVRLSYKW